MKQLRYLVPVFAMMLSGCGAATTTVGGGAQTGVAADGITITAASRDRITGVYNDAAGNVLKFDTAKTGDDLYFDLTGIGGRQLIHIETVGDNYEFSYMAGALKMHTTKAFVAAARAAGDQPAGTSTEGFVFEGDSNALDAMLQLPEIAQLPRLSRALGVRGFTGSDYPAVLALHKTAKESAAALNINVDKLDTVQSTGGYCDAYPNSGNDCYGMCGYGCSCWSWVCGDCCYHNGCAKHDDWCRSGQWYYCYNITAVIALFGC